MACLDACKKFENFFQNQHISVLYKHSLIQEKYFLSNFLGYIVNRNALIQRGRKQFEYIPVDNIPKDTLKSHWIITDKLVVYCTNNNKNKNKNRKYGQCYLH